MVDVMSTNALLNAKSVAVVGASDKAGSFGGQVVRNLVDFGYAGDIYPVNPRLSSLFDLPCSASLEALPERPDCAALAVSNQHLMALLAQAAALGIASAVVFGDPTVGDGRAPELQSQITALARKQAIAVCGPNAMGVYNLREKLVISGYPVRPGLLHDALLRFSTFVSDCGDLIAEVDVNPIRVLSTGTVALDALIVPKGAEAAKSGGEHGPNT